LEVGFTSQLNVWRGLMGSDEKKHFSQSYEDKDALDSAVLIMPLVFFMSAADPRFTSTLDTILKT
jgi:GH15 family glucan-1,4-alpha-glucosidase